MKKFTLSFGLFLVFAISISLFLGCGGGCGSGGGGNSLPTQSNIRVIVPGSLFNKDSDSHRASQTINSIKIKALASSNGEKVDGLEKIEVIASFTDGAYIADFKGIKFDYDYRFSVLHNNIELLNNYVAVASLSDGLSFDINLYTSLKTLAYEAWLKKNPSDKSFSYFWNRCFDANLKTDTDFEKVSNISLNDYKNSIIKITTGQKGQLPNITDIDVSSIKDNIVFTIVSDNGNKENSNVFKTNPSFTISFTPKYSFTESQEIIINNSIKVSNINSTKVIKKWKNNNISLSFTESLPYNSKITISMNQIKEIEEVKITPFKSFTFTTKEDTSNKFFNLSDGVSLEMVYCPAGSFIMGSPVDELGHQEDEIQHKVNLTKSFYIGKYEVTQKQYRVIALNNPSYFKKEDTLPVESITWQEAVAFCEKLNTICDNIPTGYVFDLPTEAQWEYACRAGTTTSLNNGKDLTEFGTDSNLNEVAWYKSNSNGTTQCVGQKKPNAWGIYDMHGNVCEWCYDWYDIYQQKEVTDPLGFTTDKKHIQRGVCWMDPVYFCRSAMRFNNLSTNKDMSCGFRVVLVKKE